MSKSYRDSNQVNAYGVARQRQQNDHVFETLRKLFDEEILHYLDERIINHLLDSLELEVLMRDRADGIFNDYSFSTAPAYKALVGFLFQLAKDLKLHSSGKLKTVGSYYFDEVKVDEHIDTLLDELQQSTQSQNKLSVEEKQDIKDRIKEMRGFLKHYRHTPAHFFGESITTLEKAKRNIQIIYGAIENAAKILLHAGLIKIHDPIIPQLLAERKKLAGGV